MPKFVDIHAHVNFPEYDADRAEVLKRATDAGVWMINVGTDKDTSRSAVDLAEAHDGVYATIGLHPTHEEEFFHSYYHALTLSKKVVAIGECGLDFFRVTDPALRARQEKNFRGQIELALERDLPLMIHCREAYAETLAILGEYSLIHGSKLRGNFHFFAGTTDDAQKILDLGFTMSFTGVITFAREYEKLVSYVPIDRMMSETDCPFVTPVPHRGKRNEPIYVQEVVAKIARIKKQDEEKVREVLVKNAVKFFRLT